MIDLTIPLQASEGLIAYVHHNTLIFDFRPNRVKLFFGEWAEGSCGSPKDVPETIALIHPVQDPTPVVCLQLVHPEDLAVVEPREQAGLEPGSAGRRIGQSQVDPGHGDLHPHAAAQARFWQLSHRFLG